MTRVKCGKPARARRKRVLYLIKGSIGCCSRLFRMSKQNRIKAIRQAYFSRLQKKRRKRTLWTVRLNAAARIYGWIYSGFISTIRKKKFLRNRKILSYLVILDPLAFQSLLISN